MRRSFHRVLIAVLLLSVCTSAALAQQRSPITPEDYEKWESLGQGTLSDDGKWIVYAINRVDDEDKLYIRSLVTDSTRVIEYGTRASFSPDSKWVAYIIGQPPSRRRSQGGQSQQNRQPPRNKLGLLDLQTLKETVIEEISSFSFSPVGEWLMLRGYPPASGGGQGSASRGGGGQGGSGASSASRGVDVLVRNLQTGVDTHFGNISDAAWQDEGRLLAMIVDASGKVGNGVQVYDPQAGTIRTLDSGEAEYKRLTWRQEDDDLAAMRVFEDEAYEDESHVLLAWQDLSGRRMTAREYEHKMDNRFPADTRIVDFRNLSWSDDGGALFFGIKAWEKKPEKPKQARGDSARGAPSDSARSRQDEEEEEEPANVEVWHYKDVDIIPEQKVRAERTSRENYLAVWRLEDGRFVQLGNDLTEDVSRVEGDRWAVGADQTPYEPDRMFGPAFNDYYLIDVHTGDREKVKEKLQYFFGASASGKYLFYLEDDHYYAYDIAKKTHTNITKDVPTRFVDVEDDHTVDQKPPFRFAGWTKDDRSVLLYDKYDVWEVGPDGSKAANLTNGRDEQVVHRVQRLDFEEPWIDPSEPLYLNLTGEWTKKNGYGRMSRLGRPVERLVFYDKAVGGLRKADEADVFAYVVQDYDDSPDMFVGGAELAGARQITNTNPFQDDYAWGRSELVDFENVHGQRLQGALFYPAGYEAGKQYPMIVYIYEIRSGVVHSYQTPSKTSPYNTTVFNAEGYFVFQPDIVYRDRNPGLSAVECVVPAVEKVLETGMIDPDRIGLVGHSWGAYQTSFIVTQTDLFSAAVAGAPLTDLISMYLSIYWNTGGTDARIFEISQGRMEVPFWEDLDAYMNNSALFNIGSMNTPLLVAFGDEDGAVDWHQGIELYNATRRAGKEFVLLVYPGENHSLRQEPNQLDYHKRIKAWFGHYLKGEEAPKWITEGVTHLDRQKELERQREGGGGR